MTGPVILRVVLSGRPDLVAEYSEQLAPRFTTQAGRPGVVERPGHLWEAIEQSMRQFDHRVADEARHSSILSIGSTLHDWIDLEEQLATTAHHRHSDARFARRYLAMYRSTCIGHAQRSYDTIVHLDRVLPAALATAITESERTLIHHPPREPVEDLLHELERLARHDRRTT